MNNRIFSNRVESSAAVDTNPEALFEELDDHERFAAHMMRSSAMMAGSRMHIELDAGRGRAVGSKIRMSGTMLGLRLELEEVVTQRVPPQAKVWETVGEPRLLVIGRYRMGFAIAPDDGRCRLTVFIEYDQPPPPWNLLGHLLGPLYARWCTASTARWAAEHFGRPGSASMPGM